MNIIIVHALLLTSVVSATPIPWGVENIPNPMKDPAACGRATVTQSAICDPDRLMKQSSQDAVEEVINNITSVEVAVLLVQHMDLSLYRGDVDRTAQEMAIKIHDTWGVGDASKNNGALILISAKDRAVFISVGSGLRVKLPDSTLDVIINRMKPHLRESKWDAGFVSAILDISHLLAKGELSKAPDHEDSPLWGLARTAIVVGILFGIGACHASWTKRKVNGLTRGREALNSLVKDAKSAEHKIYMTTSCPMCLEDFSTEVELGADVAAEPSRTSGNGNALTPKTLPCGHVFCEPCIKQYLDTAATSCPICRERIQHLDDGAAPPTHSACTGNHTYYNWRHHQLHMQTLMFRSRRIRERYPNVMDTSTHSVLEAAVHTGNLSDAIGIVERRSVEVQTIIADIHKKATSSGRSGSTRSSFGGGRSSGGRGGRF